MTRRNAFNGRRAWKLSRLFLVSLSSSLFFLFLPLPPFLSLSLAHILYVHTENTLCIRLLAKALERRLLTGAFDRNGIAADRNLIPLEITADYTTRRSFSTSRIVYENVDDN